MIVRELHVTRRDGAKLYRTYSDNGKRILQVETGIVYDEAIDVDGATYTYVEYEEPTDDPEDTAPDVNEDVVSAPMTRAELTAKVNELDEALSMLLSGVTQ